MGEMPMPRTALVAATALALAATRASAQLPAPPAPRDTTTAEYLGAYQRGFEQSWFIPCQSAPNEKWWVTFTDDALRQRDSILATITAPTANGLVIRLRGTVSPSMPAGHLGYGTAYLLVTEVLEIRPLVGATACGVKS